MLYNVVCCLLTELAYLSFLPCLMCASYGVDVYMCFDLCNAIFAEVLSMYFCELCAECIELVKYGSCCCCFARLILLYFVAM